MLHIFDDIPVLAKTLKIVLVTRLSCTSSDPVFSDAKNQLKNRRLCGHFGGKI